MKSRSGWISLIAAVLAVVACFCLVTVALTGGLLFWNVKRDPNASSPFAAFEIQILGQSQTVTPMVTASPYSLPPSQEGNAGQETLEILKSKAIPVADAIDLAERLKGVTNIPLTVPAPSVPLKVGDTQKFWASNTDTNQNFQVTAVLQAITTHAYVWVEQGLDYETNDVNSLANTFENHIYLTDRKFFGSEWTPGVDNDPHIYIIFARGLGGSVAGYYSAVDELNPLANQYSNAHESFFLNADVEGMDEDALGTLAHEFQHMIHWYRDRNEESWVNEGFSVLAQLLNQYPTGGFDYLFSENPDQQLTDWPEGPGTTRPYYGSSFLFVTYFLDRFGEQATQAVVANPDNGMDSIDTVLKQLRIQDPTTHNPIQADDVFSDWVLANYLRDPKVSDGRFTYKIYPDAPQMTDTEEISSCPTDWQSRNVHQYGADYIRLACQGKFTLNFEGSADVGVLPADPHSGRYAFWSNKSDDSDMTLTRTFDFSQVSAPLQMSYWTWYDLEKDYDYLYLEASLDNKNWEILAPPDCTRDNPSGESYGCGYNGSSSGWQQHSVDLSKYAGKKVQLRFEYITDPAVTNNGFLVDDIQVTALNYSADFEKDDGGWTADGFVRIQNHLPQTFRVSLIRQGQTTTVETISLNAEQKFSLPIDFSGDLKDAVLVVSGTTRFTLQPAAYRFNLQP